MCNLSEDQELQEEYLLTRFHLSFISCHGHHLLTQIKHIARLIS